MLRLPVSLSFILSQDPESYLHDSGSFKYIIIYSDDEKQLLQVRENSFPVRLKNH